MKSIAYIFSGVLLLGLSGLASAGHRHSSVGLYLGFGVPAPIYQPAPVYYYPYPRYYYQPAPVVVMPAPAPTVYVEQAPAAPAAPANMWYYCRSGQGYYPYVKTCPEGWQQVPAQPPAGQ